jgi:The  BURPS668_1122 family of deaminases
LGYPPKIFQSECPMGNQLEPAKNTPQRLGEAEETQEGGAMMKAPAFSLSAGAAEDQDSGDGKPMQLAAIQRQEDMTLASANLPPDFDPDLNARRIQEVLTSISKGAKPSEYALNGIVAKKSPAQMKAIVASYQRIYQKNLLQEVYRVMNAYPRDYIGGLYAPLSWIMESSNSDGGAPTGANARQGKDNDLLQGSDPVFGSNYVAVEGPSGEFALQGQEFKVMHQDTGTYLSATGSGFRPPYMERAILRTPDDQRIEMGIRQDGYKQYFSYTPKLSGKYLYHCYVRHQQDKTHSRIQILYQEINVKTLEEISQAASETQLSKQTGSTPIETYRAQLELQSMAMERQKSPHTEAYKKYVSQVDTQLNHMKEGTEVPVQAVLTLKETKTEASKTVNGASQPLVMYIGRLASDPSKYILSDLTPSSTRREYTGSSLEAVLQDFDSSNTYDPGVINFKIHANDRGIAPLSRMFQTDGASFWQSLSSGAGWASLGLSVLGVAALFVPGAQVAAPYLFIAAATTGAASAGASLVDRFREAEVSTTGVTLDILGIASSIIGGATAFKALSAGGRTLQLANGGRFLLYTDVAVNGASALVMSVDGAKQISGILDSNMPRGEKIGQITRVLAGMATASGLFALSVRDVAASKSNLAKYFGKEAVDGLDNQTLLSLGMLDQQQLLALSKVSRADLPAYTEIIAKDWPKASRLLQLGEYGSIAAFRRIFTTISESGLQRLATVFEPGYLQKLSSTMQARYKLLKDQILDGTLAGQDVNSRLAVLDEVRGLRTAIGDAAEATSKTQANKVNVGARNIAYGSYDLTLPDGTRITGQIASVAGDGVSTRIATIAQEKPGINQALAGRTLVPDINDAQRTFAITDAIRANDSEAKIMEYIARQIEAKTGVKLQGLSQYAGYKGRITLFSEMTPCSSCANILETQTNSMFGGSIKMNVTYGVEFP